jgi:hypothetical protein
VILLLIPRLASADLGFSIYSLLSPTHPCDNTLQLIRKFKPTTIQFLTFDFGKSTKCLDKIATKHPDLQLVAILSNESCRRSHRCGKGSFLPQYSVAKYDRTLRLRPSRIMPELRKRLSAINALGRNFIKPVIVGVGLEDNLSATATLGLLNAIRETRISLNLDRIAYDAIQNPENCICLDEHPSLICECHNPWLWETIAISSPAGCIINPDGWIFNGGQFKWGADNREVYDSRYWFKSRECDHYLWLPEWNCRPSRGWVEPWGRDCSHFTVSNSLIRQLM